MAQEGRSRTSERGWVAGRSDACLRLSVRAWQGILSLRANRGDECGAPRRQNTSALSRAALGKGGPAGAKGAG